MESFDLIDCVTQTAGAKPRASAGLGQVTQLETYIG